MSRLKVIRHSMLTFEINLLLRSSPKSPLCWKGERLNGWWYYYLFTQAISDRPGSCALSFIPNFESIGWIVTISIYRVPHHDDPWYTRNSLWHVWLKCKFLLRKGFKCFLSASIIIVCFPGPINTKRKHAGKPLVLPEKALTAFSGCRGVAWSLCW